MVGPGAGDLGAHQWRLRRVHGVLCYVRLVCGVRCLSTALLVVRTLFVWLRSSSVDDKYLQMMILGDTSSLPPLPLT